MRFFAGTDQRGLGGDDVPLVLVPDGHREAEREGLVRPERRVSAKSFSSARCTSRSGKSGVTWASFRMYWAFLTPLRAVRMSVWFLQDVGEDRDRNRSRG